MRIAIFTPYLYPFHIGMLETLKKLRNVQDVELFVTGIYGNYPFEELLGKTRVLKSFVMFGQRVLTIKACLQFITFRPHVVILFGIESVPGIMLYVIARMLRAKIAVIVEENYVTRLKQANILLMLLQTLKKLLIKSIYKHADALVAESKASMRYVIEVLKVKRLKPIYVRPHGIPLEPFLALHALKSEIAKEIIVEKLALPKNILNKVWVSFIGEPSYYKGADLLLDAIMLLKNTSCRDNCVFLFPRDLPLLQDRQELKRRYASKLAELICEGVVITYPKLSYELIPIFYRASDVIVLPSRLLHDRSSDRSPNVAIEALASGRIIIASYVGGIPDIVGEAGILVKPNDPRLLAEKVAKVVKNLQSLEHLKVLAMNKAKKHFDVRIYTFTLLKMLVKEYKRIQGVDYRYGRHRRKDSIDLEEPL